MGLPALVLYEIPSLYRTLSTVQEENSVIFRLPQHNHICPFLPVRSSSNGSQRYRTNQGIIKQRCKGRTEAAKTEGMKSWTSVLLPILLNPVACVWWPVLVPYSCPPLADQVPQVRRSWDGVSCASDVLKYSQGYERGWAVQGKVEILSRQISVWKQEVL